MRYTDEGKIIFEIELTEDDMDWVWTDVVEDRGHPDRSREVQEYLFGEIVNQMKGAGFRRCPECGELFSLTDWGICPECDWNPDDDS